MTRMEITISDDGEPDAEPLAARLRREEKELAEAEGREPKGWYFVEGMDSPQPIDFSEEDE